MSLLHDAFVYDSETEYCDALVPFAAAGVGAGEQVWIVTRSDNLALLRERLDAAAAAVHFVDSEQWYRAPATTIAGYQRVLADAAAAGAPGVRVVGEVEFGHSEIEHAEWTRYESVLNLAFADHPAWIICPYDARRLPATVVEHAMRTHPHMIWQGRREPSTAYVAPDRFVEPLPVPVAGPPSAEVRMTSSPGPARPLVAATARAAGLGAVRVDEICIAVNELVTNALVHGVPPVDLRVWPVSEGVVYEVADRGTAAIHPAAGLSPVTMTANGGAGLWLARQLADRVEVVADAPVTTIRIFARSPQDRKS